VKGVERCGVLCAVGGSVEMRGAVDVVRIGGKSSLVAVSCGSI
jgi:hypothetical protein